MGLHTVCGSSCMVQNQHLYKWYKNRKVTLLPLEQMYCPLTVFYLQHLVPLLYWTAHYYYISQSSAICLKLFMLLSILRSYIILLLSPLHTHTWPNLPYPILTGVHFKKKCILRTLPPSYALLFVSYRYLKYFTAFFLVFSGCGDTLIFLHWINYVLLISPKQRLKQMGA